MIQSPHSPWCARCSSPALAAWAASTATRTTRPDPTTHPAQPRRFGTATPQAGHTVDVADADTTNFGLDLTADADAAGVARRLVQEHSDWLPHDLAEDAKMLVSDLATNTVRHGRPRITLRISPDQPLLGVSVQDDGTAAPLPHPPDLESSRGRGW